MFRFAIAYAMCTGASYAAHHYLPESAASPYIPLLASYHMLLVVLVVSEKLTGDQKLGLSLPLPLVVVSHLAFLGGMIGMVMGREYVPLFGLLQYVIPSLAPFEVKWVFEGKKQGHVAVESDPMPQGTMDDYEEFLAYMKEGKRKFQRAGRSMNEEFAVWRTDRDKKRTAAAVAEATSA